MGIHQKYLVEIQPQFMKVFLAFLNQINLIHGDNQKYFKQSRTFEKAFSFINFLLIISGLLFKIILFREWWDCINIHVKKNDKNTIFIDKILLKKKKFKLQKRKKFF